MSADPKPERQSTPPQASFRPSTPPAAIPTPDELESPVSSLSLVPPRPTADLIKQAAKAAVAVVDTREAFERRLVREILVAERFRALFLFAFATLMLFALAMQVILTCCPQ